MMKIFLISIMLGFSGLNIELPINQTNYESSSEFIELTLRNGSLKSIPLIIPGVMNPNLSPMGNSGVNLKVGQEILFNYKGKTRVLFTVDKSYAGKVVQVHEVLKERKKEIDDDLKKKR